MHGGAGREIEQSEKACEESVRLQLLASQIEGAAVRESDGGSAGDGNISDDRCGRGAAGSWG